MVNDKEFIMELNNVNERNELCFGMIKHLRGYDGILRFFNEVRKGCEILGDYITLDNLLIQLDLFKNKNGAITVNKMLRNKGLDPYSVAEAYKILKDI